MDRHGVCRFASVPPCLALTRLQVLLWRLMLRLGMQQFPHGLPEIADGELTDVDETRRIPRGIHRHHRQRVAQGP